MAERAGRRVLRGQSIRAGGDALRSLFRAETAGSLLLLGAIAAALVWANVAPSAYDDSWGTELTVRLGSHEVGRSLREWVNSGLMTLFFVVVGLEARREFDLGELRKRSRFAMPLVLGVVAMALPVGAFLAVNAGSGAAGSWGIAMSSDTALALGAMSLLGRGVGERLRVHLLTVLVVDDLVSIVVIATVYSGAVSWMRVAVAGLIFAGFVTALRLGVDRPLLYAAMGLAVWGALLDSGIDPVAAGLAIGLVASAYTPRREGLERATQTFRAFREEPTPELALTATVAVTATQSPNARLQRLYLPWTTYVIVPVFGLANAGVRLDPATLRQAAGSGITWGIVLAMVLGKPLGHGLGTVLVTRLSVGRIRSSVGPGAVVVAGVAAAAPFTLSLLIADLSLQGPQLAQAKIGVLVAAAVSVLLTGVLLRTVRRLPRLRRAQLLLGTGTGLTDLQEPVDLTVDHVRGARDGDVTVVEYGDFECPHCGLAELTARRELAEDLALRYVWRHLPLGDVHPRAQYAAEASEAAAAQGAFWEMHDLLLVNPDNLSAGDLTDHARQLGLDVARFQADLASGAPAVRVERDVDSAESSGVAGTPTFFVNGRRHYGTYDFDSLSEAVRQARDRALASSTAG